MENLLAHAGEYRSLNMTKETSFLPNSSISSYQKTLSGPLPLYIMVMVMLHVIGVVGNSIVLFVTVKKRPMQTYTNWMILNLAVSDLAVTLFCIPLDIPLIVEKKWIYGKVFCSLYYPLGSAQLFSSAFTLVNLTYVRFYAICFPFKKQPSLCHAKIMIFAIRICSIVLVFPMIIVLKYDKEENLCYEDWDQISEMCYTLIILFLGYAIPLAVIIIGYCCIVNEIIVKKRNGKEFLCDAKTLKENRILVKLSVAVTVTFGLCVFPNQLVSICYTFANLESYQYHLDLLLGSHVLLFLYCAINPIIYNICSENFRTEVQRLLSGITAKQILKHRMNKQTAITSL